MKEKTPLLIVMMGNDQLNESKLQSALGDGVRPLQPEELKALTGADAGSIGPVGINDGRPEGGEFRILVDKRLEGANNLISGANKNDYHLANIYLKRDVKVDTYLDLRVVRAGEPCPSCGKPLRIVNAIELGHILKLGTKYSDALKANYLDQDGKEKPIIMGSYGIGVERIVACHIEQNHDKNGIIWDKGIAPFHVHLVLVNSNNDKVVSVADQLYGRLQDDLVNVLYDDRADVSPGFKFKDADLLGMPLQLVVGEKHVSAGNVEFKERRTGKRDVIEIGKVATYVERYLEA